MIRSLSNFLVSYIIILLLLVIEHYKFIFSCIFVLHPAMLYLVWFIRVNWLYVMTNLTGSTCSVLSLAVHGHSRQLTN